MGIMIYRDKDAASSAAATLLAAQMIEKPNCVLGLCATDMAALLYRKLVSMTASGILDWSEVTVFQTSEFMAKRPGNVGILSAYLASALYEQVNMQLSRAHAPNHNAQDLQAACSSFEADIVASGGLDTIVVYLGRNGHLAFNGPAREFSAFTHVELLPQNTIEESKAISGSEGIVSQAITMGMSTIMSAKRIILLALGSEVAGTAARILSSAVTPAVPASILQLHPNVTFVLDEDAAVNL